MIQVEPIIEEDAGLTAPVPLNYVSDLSHIRNDLRWQPTTTIEEGLRNLI